MKKFGWIALNIIATLAGAWILGTAIINMPINMPDWLDDALRALLHIIGHDELANPDDMPGIASLAILIASAIVCGLIVWFANIAAVRFRKARA